MSRLNIEGAMETNERGIGVFPSQCSSGSQICIIPFPSAGAKEMDGSRMVWDTTGWYKNGFKSSVRRQERVGWWLSRDKEYCFVLSRSVSRVARCHGCECTPDKTEI